MGLLSELHLSVRTWRDRDEPGSVRAGLPPRTARRQRSAATARESKAVARTTPVAAPVRVTVVPDASKRFEATHGVLGDRATYSSVSAGLVLPQTRTDGDDGGLVDEIDVHASNGSLLSVTEDAVYQAYRTHWWGSFADARVEALYRQRVWKTSRTSRRRGVVCAALAVAFHLFHVMHSFTFESEDNNAVPLLTIPSIVVCIGGVAALAWGRTSRPWVVQHWSAVSFVGLVPILMSISSVYAAVLCDYATEANIERILLAHCSVLRAGFMPWTNVVVVVVAPIVATSVFGMGWLWATALAILEHVCATVSAARHVRNVHMYQAAIVMSVAVVLMAIGTRVREMAERSFWASLHHTARAQILKEAAERIQRDTEVKREAADARSETSRTVMRYVCHELRNPLHGIMGLLEGVKGELGELEPWVAEDVDTIATAAAGMSVILNDVLDLGQLQRGAMELNPEPTDVVALIDRCVLTLRGITPVPIVSHIAASLPDLVTLDPLRVGQIMTNAISNAAKLTTEGSVELVAQVRDAKLWFEVFDTGPGLSCDGATLFEPYAQGPKGTARTTRNRFDKGTGLGLPIAAQLVRLMGGDIGLENRSDGVRGARFWFWVKLPECPPRPLEAIAVPPATLARLVDGAGDAAGNGDNATTAGVAAVVGSTAVSEPYVTHVLPPATSSVGTGSRSMSSVGSTVQSLQLRSQHSVHSTGSQAPHHDLAGSIIASSSTHGSMVFRDHRSYGHGLGGSSGSVESRLSVVTLRNARRRSTAGGSPQGVRAATLPPAVSLGGQRGVPAGVDVHAPHCGTCAGCRGCTCCDRMYAFDPFIANPSPAAAAATGCKSNQWLGIASGSGTSPGGPGGRASRATPTGRVLNAVPEVRNSQTASMRHRQASAAKPPAPERRRVGSAERTRPGRGDAPTRPVNPAVTPHHSGVGVGAGNPAEDAWHAGVSPVRAERPGPRTTRSTRTAGYDAAAAHLRLVLDQGGDDDGQPSAAMPRQPLASPPPPAPAGSTVASAAAAADVEAAARSEREMDAMRVKDCRPPSATGTAELATGPDADAGTRAKRSEKRKGRRARAGKRAGAPKEFTGVHVLVVDDERVNRTVLKRYCTKVGCTVRMMEDGDQLVDLLDNHGSVSDKGGLPDSERDDSREWDLIFLDICMQRSNGEDVCRRLRAAGVRTPLVAATGNAVREDLERYTAAGFSSVMLKPFNGSSVADMLRSLVMPAPTVTR